MSLSFGNACACIGPQGGDEFCPCGMHARGLKSSMKPASAEDEARLNEALRKMFPEPPDPKVTP